MKQNVLLSLFLIAISAVAVADMVSLPQTGQTTSYETADDGDTQNGAAWPSPRFTDNSDGTVTDNLTGLMWTVSANVATGTIGRQAAFDYIDGMNAGTHSNFGYTDWRMPNIIELQSLVDYGKNSPSLPNGHPFTGVVVNSSYHSSTFVAFAGQNNIWAVDFHDGAIGQVWKDGRYLWVVRGSASLAKTGQTTSYYSGDDGALEAGIVWPSSRFTDHGDGTVTDKLTGLMWTKNAAITSGVTWQGALDYISGMNVGTHSNFGHTDWRLPNIIELKSLENWGASSPALQSGHPFTNVGNGREIWSSTTLDSDHTKAWYSDPWYGYKYYKGKTSTSSSYVWAVRGIFTIKLPLPGGKNWKLNVQIGGDTDCSISGPDQYHTGNGYYSLDFDDYSSQNGQEYNVPIYAVAAGTVEANSTDWSDSYGWTIVVDHNNGYKTRYAHMASQAMVTSGSVTQGQQLGVVGSSGNSTGTHLHFQMYYDGSSASDVTELSVVLMEGIGLSEYTVGCHSYYPSSNTQ